MTKLTSSQEAQMMMDELTNKQQMIRMDRAEQGFDCLSNPECMLKVELIDEIAKEQKMLDSKKALWDAGICYTDEAGNQWNGDVEIMKYSVRQAMQSHEGRIELLQEIVDSRS